MTPFYKVNIPLQTSNRQNIFFIYNVLIKRYLFGRAFGANSCRYTEGDVPYQYLYTSRIRLPFVADPSHLLNLEEMLFLSTNKTVNRKAAM